MADEGFAIDLVGARTRVEFFERLVPSGPPRGAASLTPPLPPFVANYFEWIDAIESVQQARDRYVICELGAGWGKWCVRAVCALRQLNPLPFNCIAVEAEPTHYRWMRVHFADNGIDPDMHDLRWSAVAPTGGVVPFAIGDAQRWYGQAISEAAPPPLDARASRRLKARGLLGRPPTHRDARETIWVPAVTLWDVVGGEERIDLLDLDVQGNEHLVIESAAPLIDARVRRVHVGTHSRDIEATLRRIFTKLGWLSRVDYECNSTAHTPYGAISFVDGVQSWQNPRFVEGAQSAAPRPDVDVSTVAMLRERLGRLQQEAQELRRKLEKRKLRIEQLKAKRGKT